MVITMGCHLRYLNHSLFKCFVYYTRLLLGLYRLVPKRPIVFHCALNSCCFILARQATSFQIALDRDSLIHPRAASSSSAADDQKDAPRRAP